MDKQVKPLRGLLPTPEKAERQGASPASPDRASGQPHPSPTVERAPSGAPGGGRPARPSSSPSEEGLLSSAGGLLGGPAHDDSPTPSHSGGKGSGDRPDITVPPLIPGLLPGLGIDGEDTHG
jgi:hypothetical protein